MYLNTHLALCVFAFSMTASTAEACSSSFSERWPWEVAASRKEMAEQLAQKPDEFVFAGKIKSVTRLPNRATSQGNVLAERIEFDVIGLMKGTLPARVELVNVNDGICWENSPTPPTDKLTFVMAKRREGTGELESTKFAIGEEALSLLIAFTNAGMRAKPPKP